MTVELNIAKAEYRLHPDQKTSGMDLISLLIDFLLSIWNAIANCFAPEVEMSCMAKLKEKTLSLVKFLSTTISARDYISLKCLLLFAITLNISTAMKSDLLKALVFSMAISTILWKSISQNPAIPQPKISPVDLAVTEEEVLSRFFQFKSMLDPSGLQEPDLETGKFSMTFNHLKGIVGDVTRFGIQDAKGTHLNLQQTLSGTIDYKNKAILFDGDGIVASWDWLPGHVNLKKIQISQQGFKLCGFYPTLLYNIPCQTPIYSIEALAVTSRAIDWE